jgi:hypothetical protein
MPRVGSAPGEATTFTLQLNRLPLLERRTERLKKLYLQLSLIASTEDEGRKAVLRHDIVTREIAADQEYSAMSKAYVMEQLRRLDSE